MMLYHLTSILYMCLMIAVHQAYDLAVATSYTFAGVPPTFIEVYMSI